MSLRLDAHPRLRWALSSPCPVRESVPILAREALDVARRHPAGVEAIAAGVAVVLACLSVATAARTVLESLTTQETAR